MFWLHFHEIWVFTFQKNQGWISGFNLYPHYFELRKSYRTDSGGWSRKIILRKKKLRPLSEMDYWFRTKLAPWIFFPSFFAIFQGKLHVVKYGKMMNFHKGVIFCIFLSFSVFLTLFWPRKTCRLYSKTNFEKGPDIKFLSISRTW